MQSLDFGVDYVLPCLFFFLMTELKSMGQCSQWRCGLIYQDLDVIAIYASRVFDNFDVDTYVPDRK